MTSSGLYIFSISAIFFNYDPIPPCKHNILSSISAAKGNQSNNWFILKNTESSSFGSSPNLYAHSSKNPKPVFIHLSS